VNLDIERNDALTFLRGLSAMSVSAVVTDPPYFLPAQHYSARSRWPRSMADLSVLEHFYRDVVAECRRVLVPDGSMAVFCDGQSYPVFFSVMYPHFERLIDVVWDKDEWGMGGPFRRQHEWVLIGWPGGDVEGRERSVLREKRVGQDRVHPAEKPVALLRRLIGLLTPTGGLVVDPFCGSGSTGEAAIAEGRAFKGCELDPAYAAHSSERARAFQRDLLAG
jgi:site-specific DNA-methyltransferase (adenine-specific)